MSVSIWAGTATAFSLPGTATGSVGLINAPNTSAQVSGTGWPSGSATARSPTPITPVDGNLPPLAISAIGQARAPLAGIEGGVRRQTAGRRAGQATAGVICRKPSGCRRGSRRAPAAAQAIRSRMEQ
jgi:hypothetical protein